MLRPIFTLDYEIHGNGEGCPYRLMVEPTARMLDQFDRFGAKLTIMAEVAEIARYRQFADEQREDRFHFAAIVDQLRDAIARGHDVQLHLHPSYFNARHVVGRWSQDWSEYDFARLEPERLSELVRFGKSFLEALLQPIDRSYRCNVFRAANWSMVPSRNVVRALADSGFCIDTSVYKYGTRDNGVHFDYTAAPSPVVPWKVAEDDVCMRSVDGPLWEFPIYSEHRPIGAFLTLQRIHRASLGTLHRHRFAANRGEEPSTRRSVRKKRAILDPRGWMGKHAWKADFNQCTGRQLIGALERAACTYCESETDLPFVLIGHSKLYSRLNQWSIGTLLEHVARNPAKYRFGRFRDIDLAAVARYWSQAH
jgi:hypothetical protein